ncbi:MAG: hypothetical protein ACTSPD_09975 [Promethearchaeota archaeon]
MIKGTEILLTKESLLANGIEFSDDSLKKIAENSKDLEYELYASNGQVGKLYNIRYEEGKGIVADFEIIYKPIVNLTINNRIVLPNNNVLITDAKIEEAYLMIPKSEARKMKPRPTKKDKKNEQGKSKE